MNSLIPSGAIERGRADARLNPVLVYIAGLPAQSSRATMLKALDTIADIIGADHVGAVGLAEHWGRLRYEHTNAIRAELVRRYAPATANKYLSALKGVLKEAWRLGYMTAEELARATDLKGVSGQTLPAGRDVSSGEIDALLGACAQDARPAGPRDAAAIALLWAGLRRSEVAALDLADFDPDTGAVRVRQSKGRKDRLTYLDSGAAEAVKAWLGLRGAEPGPLLYHVNKGGKITPARLNAQGIYYLLKRRGKEAGLKDFSPHDFRRTAIGDYLDHGVDIATVAQLMGHSQVTTTARYDRRPEGVKRKAAAVRHLPYKGRSDTP